VLLLGLKAFILLLVSLFMGIGYFWNIVENHPICFTQTRKSARSKTFATLTIRDP
jgi:hypothetical protein